ncbi:hypothetical protein ACFE04_000797 [Oxalis oulophora]
MITRWKLVEQLREYQIRSQSNWSSSPLAFFSPKPHIVSWADAVVAIFWGLVFGLLVGLSYVTLQSQQLWLSFIIICIAIFLLIRLRRCRQTLIKSRERRILLPLSV